MKESGNSRLLPVTLQVRDETVDENEVERSIADDLISDVDVAVLYVVSPRRQRRGSEALLNLVADQLANVKRIMVAAKRPPAARAEGQNVDREGR